ncbi:MAG: Maf family nucleotide pyrophosphatase [Candidatus Paceibacterota bacterium]|jgi:septum formation protein
MKQDIILGSSSSGRKKVLADLGYKFSVMSPGIDEKAIRHDDPKKLTSLLANAKADALLERIKSPAILITSDQVVVCNGQILEKPESPAQAKDFLSRYVDHPAETTATVVVTDTKSGKRFEGLDIAKVFFDRIPDELVDRLIEKGEIMEMSGAFMIDEPLLQKYIKEVQGEPESVFGLPKQLTKRLLDMAQVASVKVA